jgi:putative PEP-CTERM system histidine kinase
MSIPAVLSFAAAYFSLILTATVLLRDRRSFVHRAFASGTLLFAAEEVFRGIGYGAILPEDVIYWQKRMIVVSCLIPAVWLGFSVGYARVNFQLFLSRWKWVIIAAGVVPITFVAIFRAALFTGPVLLRGAGQWSIPLGWPGSALEFLILFVSGLILFNLERTIRSSTGRARWQIKFMVLGVAGLFALRVYLVSQSLLFSSLDTALGATNAVALIAANALFAISLARGRLLNVDIYLSTATIQNSFTIILAGVYLLFVGVLARFARYLVPTQSLPLDAFVIFVSLTVLAILLLSNRLRRQLLLFVTRNFRRPIYDYRNLWMELTQRTTSLMDVQQLSSATAKMVSESLRVLSVNVWLVDETQQRLMLVGSTSLSSTQGAELEKAGKSAPDFIRFLCQQDSPVDLQDEPLEWANEIMQAAPDAFRNSIMRYAVGLRAGGELVGAMTLNDDRVGDDDLSTEDFVLLETLAAQLAASLLNLRLSARLRQAGEVEAFQTVSTFFVHDLKNLASKLSLTMENLPQHFDDPQFRADALRMMSGSLAKIDSMCSRLSMLRQHVELNVAECDIKHLVAATLDEFKSNLKATLEPDLQPVPKALADPEQIHKVLTNLVMNANEAMNGDGVIRVATVHEGNTVGFAVKDNGCGMSEEFIQKSLFRPFRTTKKKGLGIGLFHTKLIVEAHRGKIEVSSKPGKGTEFRVVLPVA